MGPEADLHDRLDERLRRELELDPSAVERVAARALASEGAARRSRRSSWRRWVVAGAATLLVGVLAVWTLLPRLAGASPRVSVTNQGAVLIVRGPGDRVALVHTGPPAPGAGPSILILTHGDTP